MFWKPIRRHLVVSMYVSFQLCRLCNKRGKHCPSAVLCLVIITIRAINVPADHKETLSLGLVPDFCCPLSLPFFNMLACLATPLALKSVQWSVAFYCRFIINTLITVLYQNKRAIIFKVNSIICASRVHWHLCCQRVQLKLTTNTSHQKANEQSKQSTNQEFWFLGYILLFI